MDNTNITKHIEVKPQVAFGKPVIKGTRIPAELIVGKVAGGMDIAKVGKEYGLRKAQILGALQYAANIISQEEVAFA